MTTTVDTKRNDEILSDHPQRTCVVVIGMHRSGTSALTRVISLLGAALPSNLMPASKDVNSAGFWESLDVVSLNNDILEFMNSSWDDAISLRADALSASMLAEHQKRISEFLIREFSNNYLFIIKDPRLSRLLRIWIPALASQQIRTRVILAVRHPLEVAASLKARDKFSLDKSLYLWLRYMTDSIVHSQELRRGIVILDELMADWRNSIERVGSEIDITWPIKIKDAASAIDAFIDPSLVHYIHTHQENLEACNDELLHMANGLYFALKMRDPQLHSIAQQMQTKLGEKEAWLSSLLIDQRRQFYLEVSNKNIVEEKLISLRSEFEEKCQHVVNLDRTLTSERHIALDLRNEFSEKCKHVELLIKENAHLLTCIQRLTSDVQNGEREKNHPQQGDREAQHMQFRTEMKRVEAQLQMLKSLLLNE